MITAGSPIQVQTISQDGIHAKLAGTPIADYVNVFTHLSQQYKVDANWALSYLQWESNFGQSSIGRANPTNPWDILCYPGQWGQVDSFEPGNGFCYAVYPNIETGLEAGFRLWKSYIEQGWTTWQDTLDIAVCGPLNRGCNPQWVQNVIKQGQENEARWPYTGSVTQPPPGGQPGPSPIKPPSSIPVFSKQFSLQDIVVIGSLAAIALIALLSLGNKQTGQIVIQRGGEA